MKTAHLHGRDGDVTSVDLDRFTRTITLPVIGADDRIFHCMHLIRDVDGRRYIWTEYAEGGSTLRLWPRSEPSLCMVSTPAGWRKPTEQEAAGPVPSIDVSAGFTAEVPR